MRLSTAIREGAKTGPQIRYKMFGPQGRSCALGAAAIVVSDGNLCLLTSKFPILSRIVTGPICAQMTAPIDLIIVRLNDDCLWSREKIADWVESLEVPTEITERENGHPPMVPNSEIMEFVKETAPELLEVA